MSVDRCCCRGITFAELLKLARHEHLNAAELSERTGCGQECGMCAAYLRVMLKTGLTELPVLDAAAYARLMGPTNPARESTPESGSGHGSQKAEPVAKAS
jgi:bacterioferritin-associated ferredoxin